MFYEQKKNRMNLNRIFKRKIVTGMFFSSTNSKSEYTMKRIIIAIFFSMFYNLLRFLLWRWFDCRMYIKNTAMENSFIFSRWNLTIFFFAPHKIFRSNYIFHLVNLTKYLYISLFLYIYIAGVLPTFEYFHSVLIQTKEK